MLYHAIKDHNSKYLFCNDALLEKAGFFSLREIIGKTDFDFPWLEDAQTYYRSDQLVLRKVPYMNQVELQGNTPIIISKRLIPSNGIHGVRIDLSYTEMNQFPFMRLQNASKKRISFEFEIEQEKISLSKKQVIVLRYIIMGYDSPGISELMSISPRTVEKHTEAIKEKFHVSRRGHLITLAWEYQLANLIHVYTSELI